MKLIDVLDTAANISKTVPRFSTNIAIVAADTYTKKVLNIYIQMFMVLKVNKSTISLLDWLTSSLISLTSEAKFSSLLSLLND